MNAAAKALRMQVLKRRALSIGAVKTFDHAMQFLLPIVLVRCLDAATFGQYRLLWLVVGTVMALATLNMCGTLYFFVPRSEPARKRLYIHNTIIYLALAGLVYALLVSRLNPLLPRALDPLESYGALVPTFVGLWVASILMDYLPTIDERIAWQALATGGLAALRVTLIGVGAFASGEMRVVLYMLLALVLAKFSLLLFYVWRWHGLGRPWFERATFVEQFRHSAPFGVSNALFALRSQADQWVAASLFALTSFAAFSIAAIVGQVVQILRHSVLEAFMPTMSRMEAAGEMRGMMEMNSRANVMVARLLYPLLAFAFVFAKDLITLVYTAAYGEAAPVMRVYVVGMAAMAVEVGSIVLLLRQGGFAMRITAAALILSVAVSWSAAHFAGLAGAAAGSVLAIYFDRALMLRRVSRHTGIALRELQDWGSLVWAGATAATAGVIAWLVAPQSSHFLRLVVGFTVLMAVYAALNYRKLVR
jgi:O-antigen/teichoic acid export membrane protein